MLYLNSLGPLVDPFKKNNVQQNVFLENLGFCHKKEKGILNQQNCNWHDFFTVLQLMYYIFNYNYHNFNCIFFPYFFHTLNECL
jgi:hypothetical protein